MLQNPAEIPATRGPSTSPERRKAGRNRSPENRVDPRHEHEQRDRVHHELAARKCRRDGERCADHERRVPQRSEA